MIFQHTECHLPWKRKMAHSCFNPISMMTMTSSFLSGVSAWMTWRKATNPEAQRLLKPRTGLYSHPPISRRPKSYFWWCWSSHKSMSSANSRNIYYHRPITWRPQPKAFNLLQYGNSHSFRALGHWQLESARNVLTAGGNSVSKSHICVWGALLFCFRHSLGLVYLCRHQTGVTETLPNGFYSTFTAEAPPSSITPLPALSVAAYPSCGREAISSLHMAHEMNLHLVSEQSSLITVGWAFAPPPLPFLSLKKGEGFLRLIFLWTRIYTKAGRARDIFHYKGKGICVHVFVCVMWDWSGEGVGREWINGMSMPSFQTKFLA